MELSHPIPLFISTRTPIAVSLSKASQPSVEAFPYLLLIPFLSPWEKAGIAVQSCSSTAVALLIFPEAYGLLLGPSWGTQSLSSKASINPLWRRFPLLFPRYSVAFALSLFLDFPLNSNAFSAIPNYITAWRSWTIPHFFPEYQPLLHLSNSVQRTRLLGISFALSLYLSIGRNLSYPIPLSLLSATTTLCGQHISICSHVRP